MVAGIRAGARGEINPLLPPLNSASPAALQEAEAAGDLITRIGKNRWIGSELKAAAAAVYQ